MESEKQPTGTTSSRSSYVFVLCHGTFAPGAEWVHKPKSALRAALKTGLADHLVIFKPFVWRGLLCSFLNNAHRYRVRGGKNLRTKLLKLRRKHPGAELYIIAHSHGGNVTLYAMQDQAVAAAVTGVICMATPFFVVRSDDGVQAAAEGWLGLLEGTFVLGGAFVVPLAVFASVIWLAVQILPLLNHYVGLVVGPVFTIVGLILAAFVNPLLVAAFPILKSALGNLGNTAQRDAEQRLQATLPPGKPVFCLLAAGDEFRSLFGACATAMGAIRHRYVTAALFLTGVLAVCAGQYWVVHALRGITAEALKTGEIMAILVVIGGFLLSLTVLMALVSIMLMTLHTLADRVATRLRTLLYGWERFPEMLFSNIEATPLPRGHDKICTEELAVKALHSARSYRIARKAWPKHCQIYLDPNALGDIVAWVRAQSVRNGSECQACLSLAAESEKRKQSDMPTSATRPLFDDVGSRLRGRNHTL